MKIPAGEFKTRCLQLMDDVQQRHAEILITKHGKPVAKLVPANERAEPLFGYLKGTAMVKGDIVKPVGEAWEADV